MLRPARLPFPTCSFTLSPVWFGTRGIAPGRILFILPAAIASHSLVDAPSALNFILLSACILTANLDRLHRPPADTRPTSYMHVCRIRGRASVHVAFSLCPTSHNSWSSWTYGPTHSATHTPCHSTSLCRQQQQRYHCVCGRQHREVIVKLAFKVR